MVSYYLSKPLLTFQVFIPSSDVVVTVERLDTATTTATQNNLDQTAAAEGSPIPEPAAAAADTPIIKLPTSSQDPSESEEDAGNAYESSSESVRRKLCFYFVGKNRAPIFTVDPIAKF